MNGFVYLYTFAVFAMAGSAVSISMDQSEYKIIEQFGEVDTLKYSYPEIVGMKDSLLQAKINKKLQQLAIDLLEETKQFNQKNNITEKIVEFHSRYQVMYHRNDILSIQFEEEVYVEHAAHPANSLKAITLNLKNGKEIRLGDLFEPNRDYQTPLNSWMRAYLKDEKENLGLFADVLDTFKGIKKDQEFYLTGKELVVFYQMYEYGPRPAGFLRIPIPYERIEDLLAMEL